MNNCYMCGKSKITTYRWFVYDNGDQFVEGVCAKCAELHSQLLKKGN